MIPEGFLSQQQGRIAKLMKFVDDVETDIFSAEKMAGFSLEKQYEIYALAKETLNKEIDNNLKIMKSEDNLAPDVKMLMGIVLSLTADERKKLKNMLMDLKKEK